MQGRRWLWAWGLGSMAFGAASLLIPLYVVQLGGSPVDLGLLGAMAALLGAPGAIVWGRLADRTRHPRAVVVSSFGGVGVLLMSLPLVSSIPIIIAINALFWLAAAGAGPVLTLLVVADTPERRWHHEIARLNRFQGYGWAAGLLLGIVWSTALGQVVSVDTTQRSLFVACGSIGLVSAGLFGAWIPTRTDRPTRRIDAARVAGLVSAGRRGVRGATYFVTPTGLYWSTRRLHPRRLAERFTPTLATYFGGAGLFFIGFAAFFAPLPLYLTDVGYSSDLVFALYLISSLGSATFYSGAGRLSSRFDLRLLQTGALAIRGTAMPLVAIAGGVFAAGLVGTLVNGVLFGVIGMTWAMIAVTAGTLITRLAPAAIRGEALGIYAAMAALAGAIGSYGGGALAGRYGFVVAFGTAGGFIFAGAGVILLHRGLSVGADR